MQDKIEALEQENALLKKDLEAIQNLTQKRIKRRRGILKFIGSVIAGKRLKKSILKLLNEYNSEKNVTRESISDFLANLIKRITRIGVVGILFAMLPTALLWQQNGLLKKQNTKIQQQTYLAEASRRSSQMFIMSEVLSDINNEIDYRGSKTLSNTLEARIVSLSRAMKPYKYIDPKNSAELTRLISPERGQLLITLCKSKFSSSQMVDILQASDFTYSEVNNINLTSAILRETDLANSNFSDSELINVDFSLTGLNNTNFNNADLTDANMQRTDLTNANLENAYLFRTNFKGANLTNVNLNNAKVNTMDWFNYLKVKMKAKGISDLTDNYKIDSIYDANYGKKFPTLVKRGW